MENKLSQKDLELIMRLTEIILKQFNVSVTILSDPTRVRGWTETQGQRFDWEALEWIFEIDSNMGKTTVEKNDRFGLGIVKMSKEVGYQAYRNLAGDNATSEFIDYIYENDNLWLGKLEELEN